MRKTKLKDQHSLSTGAVVNKRELVDFPGIEITDIRDKRTNFIQRTIKYNEKQFSNIDEAIGEWNKLKGAGHGETRSVVV